MRVGIMAAIVSAMLIFSISVLIGRTLGTTAQWLALPGLLAISMLIGWMMAK